MASANGGQGSGGGAASSTAVSAMNEANRAPNDLLFDAGPAFGGLVSSMRMSDAVKMACADRGIPAGVKFSGVTLHEEGQDERALQIMDDLLLHGGHASNFRLQYIQAVAAARIAYMPKRRVEHVHNGVVASNYDTSDPPVITTIFPPPVSDTGSLAILDQPTGTGKTAVALLGAVLFCAMRGGDMAETMRLEKENYMRSSRLNHLSQAELDAWPEAGSGRRCVVFVGGHLVQQWIDVVDIVREVVRDVRGLEGWKVSVVKGKKDDSSDVLEEREIRVYVCSLKTPALRPAGYLKPTIFYSVLVFDECGEADRAVNGMLSQLPAGLMYGKMIACSADLSAWKNINPNQNTVFRAAFPDWNRWSRHQTYGATKATAYAAAVFTPAERQWVMNECAEALSGISVYTLALKYVPSLSERIGGGYGVDLGGENGYDLFRRKYNVNIDGCKTHRDIVLACVAKIAVLEGRIGAENVEVSLKNKLKKERAVLINLEPRLRCLPDETCCICLGPMESASLLQPCMHSICSSPCAEELARAKMPCPTCRMKIGSTVDVAVVHGPVPAVECPERPGKKQKLDSEGGSTSSAAAAAAYPRVKTKAAEAALEEIRINCGLSPPTGVAQAVRKTLLSIKESRKRSDRKTGTLLVMVIIPDVGVREAVFGGLGFDAVTYHRGQGVRGDCVYQATMRKKVKEFERDDGRSKILFVRDGQADCMTGLDISGLDAVVSVGKGNFAQRLGRLCRFSRARLPENKKNVLYVEITPRE